MAQHIETMIADDWVARADQVAEADAPTTPKDVLALVEAARPVVGAARQGVAPLAGDHWV